MMCALATTGVSGWRDLERVEAISGFIRVVVCI
jgi:hypothetical protein